MRLFFEKDLETIRDANQQISGQVARFTLVRFILLFILVISVARAFEQINTTEIKKKRAAIADLERQIGDINNKKFYQSQAPTQLGGEGGKGLMEGSGAKATAPEIPAQTAVSNESGGGRGKADGSVQDVAHKEILSSQQEIARLQTEVAENKEKIEEIYRQAFRVKIPFVGGDPTIDLRSWIYALPFLFILSEIYLYILRKQLELLGKIAAYRIRQMKFSEISTLDHLLFSNEPDNVPPFMQQPSQFLKALSLVAHPTLAIYLVAAGRPFWEDWNYNNLILITLLLLTATFYAVAYSLYVSNRLKTQVEATVGFSLAPSRLNAFLEKAQCRARSLAARLKPGFSLTTGSLLIGVTLFLGFSIDSCGG